MTPIPAPNLADSGYVNDAPERRSIQAAKPRAMKPALMVCCFCHADAVGFHHAGRVRSSACQRCIDEGPPIPNV